MHKGVSAEGKKSESKYLALVLSLKSHEIWLCLQTNSQLLFNKCPFRRYYRHFTSIISNLHQKKEKKNDKKASNISILH